MDNLAEAFEFAIRRLLQMPHAFSGFAATLATYARPTRWETWETAAGACPDGDGWEPFGVVTVGYNTFYHWRRPV